MRSPLRAMRAAMPFVVVEGQTSTMTGVVLGRPAGGDRIGREASLDRAVRRHARDRRVGAGEQHDEAALGREPRIGREASDMAGAAQHDGHHRMLGNALECQRQRLAHQPGPGSQLPSQVKALPWSATTVGSPLPGDDAAFDRVEMQRQELQTMGGVTHEIAFHQDLGDDARDRSAGTPLAVQQTPARSRSARRRDDMSAARTHASPFREARPALTVWPIVSIMKLVRP